VVPGRFVLDTHLAKEGPDRGVIDAGARESLRHTVQTFLAELRWPRDDRVADQLLTA
jgi:hypothetical protein